MNKSSNTTERKRLGAEDPNLFIDKLLDSLQKDIDRAAENQRVRTLLPKFIEQGLDGPLAAFWQGVQKETKPVVPSGASGIAGPVLGLAGTNLPDVIRTCDGHFFRDELERQQKVYASIIFQLKPEAAKKGYRLAAHHARQNHGTLTSLSSADRAYHLSNVLLNAETVQRLDSYSSMVLFSENPRHVSYDARRGLVFFDEGKTALIRQGLRRLFGPFVGAHDYLVQPKQGVNATEIAEVAQSVDLVPRAYDVRMGTFVFRNGTSPTSPNFLDSYAHAVASNGRTQRYETAWTTLMQGQR